MQKQLPLEFQVIFRSVYLFWFLSAVVGLWAHMYQALAKFVSKHESHIHAMLECHSLTPQRYIKVWRRPGDLEINYPFSGQYRATWDCPCSFQTLGGCSVCYMRHCVNGAVGVRKPLIYSPSRCQSRRVIFANPSLGNTWRQMSALAQLLWQIVGPSSVRMI